MRVRFDRRGIELDGGLLWLDATRPKPLAVVTHAHADHVGRHETTLCTPETADLVRRRNGAGGKFLERRFGERITVGDLTVTLLAAGHILGSAMVLVEGARGSLLYTGDARPEGGLTVPPADPRPAEVLITESTFGKPEFRLPPAEVVREELVAFARACLAADETPVFLAYALGKAQELMAALCLAGVPVAAHGAVWNLCAVYRRHGIAFPGSRKLGPKDRRRAAIVVPPRFLRAPEVQAAGSLRVAAVTGWGNRARAPGTERVFPLSDHADFSGLLRLVDAVGPNKVYALHGYAEEFAATLRERGYDAEAVPGHTGPADGVVPGAFGSAVQG